VVLSFHGIPQRYADTGDPYPAQCAQTAQLLAAAMGWSDAEWTLSYQSRFGPEAWLAPSTSAVIAALGQAGVGPVLVFSPGFVTDCLETLDELGHEEREAFVEAGGDAAAYTLAPCLNDDSAFLGTLADLVRQNALGWANAAHPASAEQGSRQI
jgi:protoporphyrin/coproporphyrin ferrochelatase